MSVNSLPDSLHTVRQSTGEVNDEDDDDEVLHNLIDPESGFWGGIKWPPMREILLLAAEMDSISLLSARQVSGWNKKLG